MKLIFRNSLVTNTRASYNSGIKAFVHFCLRYCQFTIHNSILPTSKDTLLLFATFLSRRVTLATMKVCLCAVRNLHVESGLPSPMEHLCPLIFSKESVARNDRSDFQLLCQSCSPSEFYSIFNGITISCSGQPCSRLFCIPVLSWAHYPDHQWSFYLHLIYTISPHLHFVNQGIKSDPLWQGC